jgi:hypothetical protein
MSDKAVFGNLVSEYQNCLNRYYDKFLEGKDISIENICEGFLEKIKNYGNFYSEFIQEYKNEKAKLD